MKKLVLSMMTAAFLLVGYATPSDAAVNTGWVKTNGHWSYYITSGSLYKGWLNTGGKWYYLDGSGVMKTGWVYTGGKWYFMNGSGAMQTDWVYSGGKWYYLDSSGAMKTGWVKIGGIWYYLDSSGAMKTGWIYLQGTWYYLSGSGAMQTGWIKDGGKWYYLASNGAMAHDTVIDGYTVDHSGAWVTDPEESKFQNNVHTILSGAKQQQTTLGKVLYVRNAVINMTDYKLGEDSDNPFGPLVHGQAVCEGYAMTMNYLLAQLNIPSRIVYNGSGFYEDSHGWNLVQVDGKWYHLDATWDDGSTGYNYFLLPDNVIKESQYHTNWYIFRYFEDSRWWGVDGWGVKETQIPAATDNKFMYIHQMSQRASDSTTDYKNFYYINRNDNSIWEMSLDGSSDKKFVDGNFARVIYLNGSLYTLDMTYVASSNQNHITISKVSTDGTDVSEVKSFNVADDFTWKFYVEGQTLYLTINGQVYKITE